ncbi:MAG: hypothetical protein ACPG5W_12585, partial [Flavobacteriales bacterium]
MNDFINLAPNYQRQMNDCVEIQESPIHGKGVFAIRDIKAGEIIAVSHVTLLHHNEQMPELIATLE